MFVSILATKLIFVSLSIFLQYMDRLAGDQYKTMI